MITFNKPFLCGSELRYIEEAVNSGKISGDGMFTKKCHQFFENKYGFKKTLLTTSCTHALEMAAILINIQPGDEVIMPSYTFVSTANAFVLRGAKIVFADSNERNPNLDASTIESLISPKTRAIVVVHYAGIACDMDQIMALAGKNSLWVVEDAAQAVDSYHNGRPLGSIGHLSAFSFHETKNIISGEGGMLVVNDERFFERAEIIREKGTNRSKFFRGEIDKYGWVDIGSSYLPSEVISAFLYAQLERIDEIQQKRRLIWDTYHRELQKLTRFGIQVPHIDKFATNNAHMYYVVCRNVQEREQLIAFLKAHEIQSVFHYISLHSSPYFGDKHDGRLLANADRYSDTLLRLPLYYSLKVEEAKAIAELVTRYYTSTDELSSVSVDASLSCVE
jgi:dTDP-4-amino-4,6-dideoxygalactose transaminase